MKELTEVLVTHGLNDLVIRIEADSIGQLDKIFTDIRQMTEIRQTSTLGALNKHRNCTGLEKAFILRGP
jgi:DNA-binding Lrp family transcriptional regulator